jgi:hypothetical protein
MLVTLYVSRPEVDFHDCPCRHLTTQVLCSCTKGQLLYERSLDIAALRARYVLQNMYMVQVLLYMCDQLTAM